MDQIPVTMADYQILWTAIANFDLSEALSLITEGADPNARDGNGELLIHAPELWAPNHDLDPSEDVSGRHTLVRTLLDLGANPHVLDTSGQSLLLKPIMAADAAMLQLLLETGVDPNHGCCDRWQTVYDLAKFDHMAIWGWKWGAAIGEPTEDERADDDAFLRWLDREALTAGWRRPECLFLLRRHGALSRREMARRLGGDGSEKIEWRDNHWHLVKENGGLQL